ncbi:MAG: hypothetical protein ABIF09_13550 [Gemmatimonadota bacterium]
MTQHSGLDEARWSQFDLDQQILMIGNEMNRGLRLARAGRPEPLRRGYERILRLVDLTAQAGMRPALRRELLRWRTLVADLYLSEEVYPGRHEAAFRGLLQLQPIPARQIPLLLGPPLQNI